MTLMPVSIILRIFLRIIKLTYLTSHQGLDSFRFRFKSSHPSKSSQKNFSSRVKKFLTSVKNRKDKSLQQNILPPVSSEENVELSSFVFEQIALRVLRIQQNRK
ncbi:CLUMA_CG015485, isoform A [Clunio marinus]|uniref:CLUMA_CG015485, isoform A n=1 Tax=Clunio marinus TaxID=568069 RepID=A0A1J1IU96_9DIPT|nr:CLUMA_CG015485, isoform A [Clunio marinus]